MKGWMPGCGMRGFGRRVGVMIGARQVKNANDLGPGGTVGVSTQSLCFLPRVSHQDTGCAADSEWPIVLNERWRVVVDPLQWILQVGKGRKGPRHTGWAGRSFCTTRATLKREIRRLAGDVDPAALAIIDGLPDQHPHYGPGHC